MDPLEEADDEAGEGGCECPGEVDGRDCHLAIEAVVEAGEGGAGDEEADSCEVEAQEHAVGF